MQHQLLFDLQNFLDNSVADNLDLIDFSENSKNIKNIDFCLQKSQNICETFPQKSAGFFALTILYKHLQKYDLAIINACSAIVFADDFLYKNKEKLFNLLSFLDNLANSHKKHLINFLKILYDDDNRSGKFHYFSLNKLFNQDNLYRLHGCLAFMYNEIGDFKKAKKHADFAIIYDKFDGYHKSLMFSINANVCNVLGDLTAAENYARQAIKLNPKGDGNLLLGIVLSSQGKRFEAIQVLSKACEIQPQNHQTWERLACAMLNIGEAEIANQIAEIAVENVKKNPNATNFANALLNTKSLHLLINIFDKNCTTDKTNKIGNFAKHYADLVKKYKPQKFTHNKNNFTYNSVSSILKIGFVSGDFCLHPVSFFLLDILKYLQNHAKQIEIFLYSTKNPKFHDSVTAEFQQLCNEKFCCIYGKNDDEIAQQIFHEKINILFDLSGYTLNHRLDVFKQKPAPIQISWMGWVATTGLPTMDYFFADKFSVPENLQQQFVEKIYYLPNIWECYTPSEVILQTKITNTFQKKSITFGSFNDPKKVSDYTIFLWSQILNKIPRENSKFIWTRNDIIEKNLQQKFLQKFLQHGVKAEQIEFRGINSYADYLEKYNDVDLILDTFPVSGMTTTAEALLMGVPTLTLLGETMASRLSGACLNALDDFQISQNLICQSENEFINKAIAFFENPQILWDLRENLRQKTINSNLCNTKLFAENFVIALQKIWSDYLEK